MDPCFANVPASAKSPGVSASGKRLGSTQKCPRTKRPATNPPRATTSICDELANVAIGNAGGYLRARRAIATQTRPSKDQTTTDAGSGT
jgi:hypothetical protein